MTRALLHWCGSFIGRGLRVQTSVSLRSFYAVPLALAGLVLFAAASPQAVEAQDNAACLMCHGNRGMFSGADARRLFVDTDEYGESLHGGAGLQCAMCHREMSFPHPEEQPAIDCGLCHTEQGYQHGESLHGRAEARGDPLAPACITCHGGHEMLPHEDLAAPTNISNIPLLCGSCHREGSEVSRTHNIHQDSILENYSQSIHGVGFFEQGLTVTAVCTSCHTSHFILPHTDRRSSINQANVAATCAACHSRIEQVHRQVIDGQLWESDPGRIPVCVECHSPHEIRNVVYEAQAANRDCLGCHSDPGLTMDRDGETVSIFVDELAHNTSAHANTACAQCHTDVTASRTRTRACETSVASNVNCAACHAEAAAQYEASTHGLLAAGGDEEAPTCQDCHTKHAEQRRVMPTSGTFPRNVPELCGNCHRDGESVAARVSEHNPRFSMGYEMSIHGTGLTESGLLVTATCSSCHGAHLVLAANDSLSSVHEDNVAGTCGACHFGIEEEFRTSIHWPGNGSHEGHSHEEGEGLPACNDCHTSHSISRTDQGDFRLTMMNQCGNCHEEEAETFFDTFHGKVSRLGDDAAAKCYDCHGTHGILPISEPASTLSRENILETCSQCHESANERFTGYLTHATHHDQGKYPYLFWTFWGMTALLVGTLTFALAHTGAWLFRLSRTPGVLVRHHPAPGELLYRRFTRFQRRMHMFMMISFLTLALTGMMLKFSYMGWAQISVAFLGGFATTGVLHRTAAVTLIIVFLVHLVDVWRQKQASGKSWFGFITGPDSTMFNMTDLREFWGSIKWFLGRGPRPHYGRFTYWEKFDYFAVFWGMFVIGSTGLLLWFPELFTKVLPGWTVNVATIIHSDEALLATAFIFTVHFFNTHFRPDKMPMDPVIFTGRVPLEEFKRDKPREYERRLADGTLDDFLVKAYDSRKEIRWKIFGFTALGIGLTVVVLIVYSMLFGYR